MSHALQWVDSEDGHLFLGGNSTDRAKAAWLNSISLITEIQADVIAALQVAGEIL